MNPGVHLRRAQLHAARSLAGSVRAAGAATARALLCGVLALSACSSGAPRSDFDAALDGGSDAIVIFLDAAVDFSVVVPDGGSSDASIPMCETVACDPRLALACGPEGLNACRLAADGPVCAGVIGTVPLGGECTNADACAAGLDCFAAPGGLARCSIPCCPGDDASCMLGGHCATSATLVDGTATSWGRCVPPRACDVLRGDAVCDLGEGCYIISSRGETDCRTAGSVDVGGACDGPSACLPGLFCAGLMARTCVRICALGDGGAGVCPTSEGSCRAYPYSPAGTGICST